MTVPFIRMFPGGGRGLQEITRPGKIEKLACKFIAMDGRFLIEIIKDGTVSLIAIIDVDGKAKDVARESCPNGPELSKAVDRLIRAAVQQIPLNNPARLLAPAQHENNNLAL